MNWFHWKHRWFLLQSDCKLFDFTLIWVIVWHFVLENAFLLFIWYLIRFSQFCCCRYLSIHVKQQKSNQAMTNYHYMIYFVRVSCDKSTYQARDSLLDNWWMNVMQNTIFYSFLQSLGIPLMILVSSLCLSASQSLVLCVFFVLNCVSHSFYFLLHFSGKNNNTWH